MGAPTILATEEWDTTPPDGVDDFHHQLSLSIPLIRASDKIFFSSRGGDTAGKIVAGGVVYRYLCNLPQARNTSGLCWYVGAFAITLDSSLHDWVAYVDSVSGAYQVPLKILP